MVQRSRVEQRDHLMTALGMLADPIRRLIDSLPGERHKSPYVESQFRSDLNEFRQELLTYCRPGRHDFAPEFDEAIRVVGNLLDHVRQSRNAESSDAINRIRSDFEQRMEESRAAIRNIPCDDPGTILPAASPLQTYMRLRAINAGVRLRLDVLDPYLTAEVFHRYLADVPPTAMLQVVTSDKVMNGADTVRRDRIVAVSELLAAERRVKYRFLVTSQQHDRHCRADDEILHLGGSVAHASMFAPYTVSKLDPSQSNHAFLDQVIAGATEWYGPTVTTHRKS